MASAVGDYRLVANYHSRPGRYLLDEMLGAAMNTEIVTGFLIGLTLATAFWLIAWGVDREEIERVLEELL